MVNAGTVSTEKIPTRFVKQGGPDIFHTFVAWLAGTFGSLGGYPDIMVLMALVVESGILTLSYWRKRNRRSSFVKSG